MLRDHGYTMEENTSFVSHDVTISSKLPSATPTKHINFAMEQINVKPILLKTEIILHSVIRQVFRITSIPPEIANFIADSWRATTKN